MSFSPRQREWLLRCLMPNLRGPSERKRRLYAKVVHSVIMYGAPVWAKTVARDKKTSGDVHRVQRRLALRIISAYRTVSHEAAEILESFPGIFLQTDIGESTNGLVRRRRTSVFSQTEYALR